MKTKSSGTGIRAATFAALALASLLPASAQLASEYGILDLTANGGINPNTGVAWQAGDQYRLAFHTAGTITATSSDPAVYDAFATAQAQQNTALASSTGWTAMVWVNTDDTLPQAANPNAPVEGESPVSSPVVRSGTTDSTGGGGQGGAGVPVYAMDGSTCIARNNADIYNGWSNPFESGLATPEPTGNGNNTQRLSGVFYSPFLDQFGAGDTGSNHGADVWTGGFGNAVNPLGNSVDPDTQIRASWGSSNANNSGRVWNRFQSGTSSQLRVYAISPLLTVQTAAAETFQLRIARSATSPGNFDFEWESQPGKVYDLVTSVDLADPITEWPIHDPDGEGGNPPYADIPADEESSTTTLTEVPGDGAKRFFAMLEKDAPPPPPIYVEFTPTTSPNPPSQP